LSANSQSLHKSALYLSNLLSKTDYVFVAGKGLFCR